MLGPILSFPQERESRQYRRRPSTNLLGFPPVGTFKSGSIRRQLWDIDANKSAITCGDTGNSQGPILTDIQSTVDNWSANQAGGAGGARYVPSRLYPYTNVFYIANSDALWNFAFSGGMSYTLRNFSFFMYMRRRKEWSAQISEPVQGGGGQYICQFLGATNVFYYWFYNANGTVQQPQVYDGTTFRCSGVGTVMAHTFDLYGFTIDNIGNMVFYENGKASAATTSVMPAYQMTGFTLGRSASQFLDYEIARCVAYQYVATDDEIGKLQKSWRQEMTRLPNLTSPSTTLVVTGDSITAGETYINNTSRLLPTICEMIAAQDSRLRVSDLTESSTFINNGVQYMNSDNSTKAAGGNVIHSLTTYPTALTVSTHARNDLVAGDSVATVAARIEAMAATQVALGQKFFVGNVIGTIMATFLSPCAVATTGTNITLSGEQVIDGVLTTGSRVLVKDQTDATTNGIYVSAVGAWSRSADANTGALVEAIFVIITSGTINAGNAWAWQTAQPRLFPYAVPTLGVTNLTFAQMAYTNQAGFDANCTSFNSFAWSGNITAAIPVNSVFTPGTAVYTNATYYAGDNIHPNGNLGAYLRFVDIYTAIAPFIN